jgi:hypothetical protein
MTTAMRVVLLVLVALAVAAGIWCGVWLFDRVTAPSEPALSLATVVPALTR